METKPDNSVFAKQHITKMDDYKSDRWCQTCWLLTHLCVCQSLTPISNFPHQVAIYMHFREYKRTTNTGIIAHNLLPQNSNIFYYGIHEEELKFTNYIEEGLYDVCALFPSKDAMDIEEWKSSRSGDRPIKVVLLDGTWKQGKRMARHIPEWVTKVKLAPEKPSMFKGRKQKVGVRLSTIEALALFFKQAGNDISDTLLDGFYNKDRNALKQSHKYHLLDNIPEPKPVDT
jgi:DTW domain-containing protein YfiP